jgi:heme-degrading monooxygenase HmoA
MSIIRLIHIKVDPSETETAERIWKTECATLMIAQRGCISEKLLRARDRGEFISYSEWETEADKCQGQEKRPAFDRTSPPRSSNAFVTL